ncbi:MAG: NADH-quinone oxidoreductase subunit NuoK [Planctomycetes bacterium]|nr:NADH-quinone oxidoreductase subunit NuoK [Planctomycetota bacterium]
MFSLRACLVVSAALLATGVYGVVARRNIIIVLLSVEVMLNGAALAFAAFGRQWLGAAGHAGQVVVLLTMAVAAAEAGVGLALLLAFERHRRCVDSDDARTLRG